MTCNIFMCYIGYWNILFCHLPEPLSFSFLINIIDEPGKEIQARLCWGPYCSTVGGSDGKVSACDVGDLGLIPVSGGPLEKGMAPHLVFLPGNGQKGLAGYRLHSRLQRSWIRLEQPIQTEAGELGTSNGSSCLLPKLGAGTGMG